MNGTIPRTHDIVDRIERERVARQKSARPPMEAAERIRAACAKGAARRPHPHLTLVWRNDQPVSDLHSQRFKDAIAEMRKSQAKLDETLGFLNDD